MQIETAGAGARRTGPDDRKMAPPPSDPIGIAAGRDCVPYPLEWPPLHRAARYSPEAVVGAILTLYPEAIEKKTEKRNNLPPSHLVHGNPNEMNVVVRLLTSEWPMALENVKRPRVATDARCRG